MPKRTEVGNKKPETTNQEQPIRGQVLQFCHVVVPSNAAFTRAGKVRLDTPNVVEGGRGWGGMVSTRL